jgi:hypothetical protein
MLLQNLLSEKERWALEMWRSRYMGSSGKMNEETENIESIDDMLRGKDTLLQNNHFLNLFVKNMYTLMPYLVNASRTMIKGCVYRGRRCEDSALVFLLNYIIA